VHCAASPHGPSSGGADRDAGSKLLCSFHPLDPALSISHAVREVLHHTYSTETAFKRIAKLPTRPRIWNHAPPSIAGPIG
jgi:hypothetical protein